MRNNKGAIAVYTLLAMLFFLIFVMMIYNNVSSKAKAQVQTTEVLQEIYVSDTDSSAIVSQMMVGELTDDVIKTEDQENVSDKILSGSILYLAIDGKIYN